MDCTTFGLRLNRRVADYFPKDANEFQTSDLPYDVNSLEPNIDARTMGIHHSKHHQAYMNNLNAALESHPELQDKTAIELVANLDAIPDDIRLAVRTTAVGTSITRCSGPL